MRYCIKCGSELKEITIEHKVFYVCPYGMCENLFLLVVNGLISQPKDDFVFIKQTRNAKPINKTTS